MSWITRKISLAARKHVIRVSGQFRNLTTPRTAAFPGGSSSELRRHPFSLRTLSNSPRDGSPGTAFLIEPWAAAEKRYRSLGSAAITLAIKRIPRKASASSARASMKASIFSTTAGTTMRSEEHTSELQSRLHLVCRLLLEKKKNRCVHTVCTD